MLAREQQFRLLPAPPVDPNRVIAAFVRLVDAIQARDDCNRIEALQRASNEHPTAYSLNLWAPKKVLSIEWTEDGQVHIIGFHGGEWKSQFLALPIASGSERNVCP